MNVHPKTLEAYELLHKGTLALARAERQGIRVDIDRAENEKQRLTKLIKEKEELFKETALYRHWVHCIGGKAPNIHSNQQLAHYLYKVKKLEPITNTTGGGGSTDDETLTQLGIPELNEYLLPIRKLKKIRDTYLEAFLREQVNGFIHPSFSLNLAVSYRSSSSSPNFQNVPKRDKEAMNIVRGSLFPRIGNQLLEVDFSGAEVRLSAVYCKDPQLIKYITDPTTDMHGDLARQIFIVEDFNKKVPEHYTLRQAAKNGFTFPQFYGSYYKNCAKNISVAWTKLPPNGKWKKEQGIPMPNGSTIGEHLISKGIRSIDDFTKHLKTVEDDFWGNRFKVYAKWKEKNWSTYQKIGYVDMYTGFRCNGVMGKNEVNNYPIQGASFHCLLWCFTRMDEIILKENLRTKIIGQIHDSIVLDCHPDELVYVLDTMNHIIQVELKEHFSWISVPIEADNDICPVDGSWATLGKFKITR